MIVFGNSSVDSGNNNQISTIARSNFKPYGRDFAGGKPTGRSSNGRIPSDFISEALGLKPIVPAYLDPMYNISDFATGVCFASAGAGYDNATSDVLPIFALAVCNPSVEASGLLQRVPKETDSIFGHKEAKQRLADALYLISIGTNDFLENYYSTPRRQSEFTIEQYQHFLIGIAENFIKQL